MYSCICGLFVVGKQSLQLDDMTGKEIDDSDIPPLTDDQLAAMKPLPKVLSQAIPNKVRITIRLDADTLQSQHLTVLSVSMLSEKE